MIVHTPVRPQRKSRCVGRRFTPLAGDCRYAVAPRNFFGAFAAAGVVQGPPGPSTEVFNTPGTHSWVVPPSVTSIFPDGYGAGGGGGRGQFLTASAGGAGGSRAWTPAGIAVTPGETLTIVVGAGGLGATANNTTGTAGGDTEIRRGSDVLFRAKGGPGNVNNNTGGVATTAGSVASNTTAGSNGGTSPGGGAGGPGGAGATPDGGAGGVSGGTSAAAPGGGGAGGNSSPGDGQPGAAGRLTIQYTMSSPVYTTVGAQPFVVPSNVTQIWPLGWSGGGGGAWGVFLGGNGGGGAGGIRGEGPWINVTPGETLTIIIGAGGTAGATQNAFGGVGGDTEIRRGGTTLWILKGQPGGESAPNYLGGQATATGSTAQTLTLGENGKNSGEQGLGGAAGMPGGGAGGGRVSSNGQAGFAPGGGASGGASGGSPGAAGARGELALTW